MSYDPSNLEKGIFNTPTSKVAGSFVNSTGGLLSQLTVVRVLGNGSIGMIDVTDRDQVYSIFGALESNVANGDSVSVISKGRIKNITTSFNTGDVIFLDKSSNLTNITPEIGVNGFVVGDFVVRLGIIVQNEENPSNKDIIIDIQIIGSL